MRVWWLVLLAAFPMRGADACVLIGNAPFVAGEPTEAVPPGPVIAGDVSVSVGGDDPDPGCGHPTSDCAGYRATIRFAVSASDDTTPVDELGYRVRVVGPLLPYGIITSDDRDRVATSGILSFTASLRDEDDEFEVDFDIGVSAIDASGNVGPETIVHVTHRRSGGCRSGRGVQPFGAFVLALGTLGLLLHRRR